MKKIIIGVVVLAAIGAGVYYFALSGEYESDLEKSALTTTVDTTGSAEDLPPSIDQLEGLYAVNSEKGNAEVIFEIDGLKNTKGAFEQFTVDFNIDDNFENSALEIVFQVSSINTENSTRDEHLMDVDFFNESAHPTMKYMANQITYENNEYTAQGHLTLVGETNNLAFPFKHLGGGTNDAGENFEAFEGGFEFDRTQYGMQEEGGVGNIVTITFYAELVKS